MVPEYFKFPGYLAPSANLKFADVPNGVQAITKVPAEGRGLSLLLVAMPFVPSSFLLLWFRSYVQDSEINGISYFWGPALACCAQEVRLRNVDSWTLSFGRAVERLGITASKFSQVS